MAQKSIKLGPLRCAFVYLDKPNAFKGKDGSESKAKYKISLLIPKSDKATHKIVKDFLAESIDANGNWKTEKKKQLLNRALKTVTDGGVNNNCVIRDGDELNRQNLIDGKSTYDFYKDHYVISLGRPAAFGAPLVVDRKAVEIPGMEISSAIRPGYWVNAEVSAYTYEGANPGISLQFSGVQLVKKDEEFGRQNNFEAIEGADDEEETSSSFQDDDE